MNTWSGKIYAVCDEVLWLLRLNLAWLVFTLLGGVLLGIGPATVAAYSMARRHAQGGWPRLWTEFAAVFRREFVRGSVLVLPILAATGILIGNLFLFAGTGAAWLTFAALIAVVVITAHLLPMYVHYNLRGRDYLPKASLFALTHPASSIVLLFVFISTAYAAETLPILAFLLGGGAWIQLNTWLVLRFFAENDAKLAQAGLLPKGSQ